MRGHSQVQFAGTARLVLEQTIATVFSHRFQQHTT